MNREYEGVRVKGQKKPAMTIRRGFVGIWMTIQGQPRDNSIYYTVTQTPVSQPYEDTYLQAQKS